MDPVTAKVGQTALGFAVDQAGEHLREARNRRADDAGRCEKYLEAALAAIEGLEREYDEILIAATHVGSDADQVASLRRRIDEYLKVDRLRPRLHEAIEGLEFYVAEFTKRSDSYLQWPWKRGDRRRAVKEFGELLERLRGYLRDLDQQGLEYRAAGTGVGIEALIAIQAALAAPAGLRDEPVGEVASRYQKERNKEVMFDQISRIRRAIEESRRSFGK